MACHRELVLLARGAPINFFVLSMAPCVTGAPGCMRVEVEVTLALGPASNATGTTTGSNSTANGVPVSVTPITSDFLAGVFSTLVQGLDDSSVQGA